MGEERGRGEKVPEISFSISLNPPPTGMSFNSAQH